LESSRATLKQRERLEPHTKAGCSEPGRCFRCVDLEKQIASCEEAIQGLKGSGILEALAESGRLDDQNRPYFKLKKELEDICNKKRC
jgi:hypothetical protein